MLAGFPTGIGKKLYCKLLMLCHRLTSLFNISCSVENFGVLGNLYYEPQRSILFDKVTRICFHHHRVLVRRSTGLSSSTFIEYFENIAIPSHHITILFIVFYDMKQNKHSFNLVLWPNLRSAEWVRPLVHLHLFLAKTKVFA